MAPPRQPLASQNVNLERTPSPEKLSRLALPTRLPVRQLPVRPLLGFTIYEDPEYHRAAVPCDPEKENVLQPRKPVLAASRRPLRALDVRVHRMFLTLPSGQSFQLTNTDWSDRPGFPSTVTPPRNWMRYVYRQGLDAKVRAKDGGVMGGTRRRLSFSGAILEERLARVRVHRDATQEA